CALSVHDPHEPEQRPVHSAGAGAGAGDEPSDSGTRTLVGTAEGTKVPRRHGRPPLLPVVGIADTAGMTNIIVGLDGSSSSRDALRWAQREGELRKASVTAVLAWGLLDQHHPNNDQPFDPDYHQQDARNALDAYVSEAVGEG